MPVVVSTALCGSFCYKKEEEKYPQQSQTRHAAYLFGSTPISVHFALPHVKKTIGPFAV
jgi:hypothetical protein